MSTNDASVKKRILILSIIAGVILISAIMTVVIGSKTGRPVSGAKTALIYSDGELIKKIDLDLSEDTTFLVETKDGGSNLIQIKDHDICVSEATCPNGLCIKQGFAGKTHIPVVCLPNKLVIIVENNTGGKEGEYDTITY